MAATPASSTSPSRLPAPDQLLKPFRSSISRRFAVSILLFSSALAIAVTGFQIAREYQRELQIIDRRFDEVRASYLSSLVENAWVMDRQRLEDMVHGIAKLPEVQYVALLTDVGLVTAAGSMPPAHANTRVREFALERVHRGIDVPIGRLQVVASLEEPKRRAVERTTYFLVANGIAAGFIAVFVLAVFELIVGKHLRRIAQFARGASAQRDAQPLRLERRARRDELQDAVDAMNDMRGALLRENRKLTASVESLEEDARRSSAEHSILFANVTQSVITYDVRGQILEANPAASRLFGLAYLPGKRIQDLLGTDEAPVDASEKATRLAIRRADGTQLPVELIVAAAPSQTEGKYLTIVRDVSAQAAIKSLHERLSVAIESMRDGFAMFDVDERLVLVNNRFSTLLPSCSRMGIGSACDAIVACLEREDMASCPDFRQRHKSAQSSGFPFRARTIQGVELEFMMWRLRDGSRATIVRDVTVEADREMLLVSEVEAAHRANAAKNEFLSHMSHELRTPLNAILGFAQLLQMEELTRDQSDAVGEVRKAALHLLELIGELLDLSRIESGRMSLHLEPVAIDCVVAEAVQLVRAFADERSVAVENRVIGCVVRALADRTRLRQVLVNLLTNGSKYNRPGGLVVITADASSQRIRIFVRDTGIGMDATKLARLFTLFDRLGAERSSIEGVGIGLALSKRLVLAMGGQLNVASEPGRGSTFSIELPVTDASDSAESGGDTKSEVDVPRRLAVLYIEDNPANTKLLQSFCRRQGHLSLTTAATAEEGLALVQGRSPDIILMDINLPGIDGYEALRRLRSFPDARRVPVVALSADAMPHDVERGLRAGFDAYLRKPIDFSELIATIERLSPGLTAKS